MVMRSTEEAMETLRAYRSFLIERGRYEAIRIAERDGTVHSRQVRQCLQEAGLLADPAIGDYWLGAVFNKGPFVWTGEWHTYGDDARNIHTGHVVKLWRLAPGVRAGSQPQPPRLEIPDTPEGQTGFKF